jgi:micrococcal nuclease
MRYHFLATFKVALFCFVILIVTTLVLGEEVVVTRVIDGDTIVVGKRRIRLIGVDTPELRPVQPFGLEAKVFVEKEISGVKGKVKLTIDGSERDRYGRELRHVYIGESMLAEKLLFAGLAKAELKYNYSRTVKRKFLNAEQQAKRKKLGIWGESK